MAASLPETFTFELAKGEQVAVTPPPGCGEFSDSAVAQAQTETQLQKEQRMAPAASAPSSSTQSTCGQATGREK